MWIIIFMLKTILLVLFRLNEQLMNISPTEGQPNPGDIVINELMASNVDVVADADGAYDD